MEHGTALSYGSWPSPITAAVVAEQGLRLSAVVIDGDDVYWLEGRPAEGGRNVLVRRSADGHVRDVTPPGFNVRTRVHEYGGGAFAIDQGAVYFSNFSDQRIYRLLPDSIVPEPITAPGDCFFADAVVDRGRARLISVREDHTDPGREPVTTLVSVSLTAPAGDGDPRTGHADAHEASRGQAGYGTVITSGYDFYSTPRLSPDGSTLAWLSWNHPQMPWDGTELWVARVTSAGTLADARRVAGGSSESIYQPGWSPDGVLYFASDRSGWWQLYRWPGSGRGSPKSAEPDPSPVLASAPPESEFGRPAWAFGTQTWTCAGASRLVASYAKHGRWHLAMIDVATGSLSPLAVDFQPHEWLAADADDAVLVASSAATPPAVIRMHLDSGRREILRATTSAYVDPAYVSVPESIEYRTADDRVSHAFYYAPRNRATLAPAGEKPPLIAISHGGPTTAASATLDLRVQFWTSRGFAVVDVNYRGSSGYGRPYREQLKGQWGIVDVDDMIAAVRHLTAEGKADPNRLIIRGGSAGGYTTLAALTTHPEVFKAGASYYGVSDIEVLARDTHKFESRYLDTLVGPYPAMQDVYRARSPIHQIEQLSCALIFFQGLEDKVVPPNQSAAMADAVRRKGLPVAYLAFEGEQHGFRRAETIVRCLEAELGFYGAVFGFTPADPIAPVPIDNL